MKRKIVQQGYSTLMISLPSKWTKKNNLEKGDEINIEENTTSNNNLIISTNEKKQKKTQITINIDNTNPLTNRLIASAYKKGYDIVRIEYVNQKLIQKLQKEILLELIGFEIIEQGKNYCLLSEVSKSTQEEFENLLKRTFYTIKNMLFELIKSLKENEKDLSYIISMDFNINKYSHFCDRIINKNLYTNEEKKHITYYIILTLDSLGDSIKELTKEIQKENSIDNKELELIENTFKIYEQLLSLFYNNSRKKIITFAKEWQKVIDTYNFENKIENKIKEILIFIIKIFEHSLTMDIEKLK